jgi:hypothetical protein
VIEKIGITITKHGEVSMKALYKEISEEIKLLKPEEREKFIDNVAKLLAVRPYRFSERNVSLESQEKEKE